MKNVMKKVIAICLVASVAVAAFGCSSGKKGPVVETMALEDAKQELEFNYSAGGNVIDATEGQQQNDATEPNQAATQPAEPATEIVEVTDESGEAVTDAAGVVQTEVVTIPVATDPATEPAPTHTPSYDLCKANWLDMSKAGDYFFNGEFLIIEFKLNDDLPDGFYPVSVYETDIASWELVTHKPTLIDGGIAVGSGKAEEQAAAGDDFTLTVDNTTAKAGDTVKVAVNIENNPGFCGFIIDVKYDAAAMTIVDAYGGSEFDAAISVVQ